MKIVVLKNGVAFKLEHTLQIELFCEDSPYLNIKEDYDRKIVKFKYSAPDVFEFVTFRGERLHDIVYSKTLIYTFKEKEDKVRKFKALKKFYNIESVSDDIIENNEDNSLIFIESGDLFIHKKVAPISFVARIKDGNIEKEGNVEVIVEGYRNIFIPNVEVLKNINGDLVDFGTNGFTISKRLLPFEVNVNSSYDLPEEFPIEENNYSVFVKFNRHIGKIVEFNPEELKSKNTRRPLTIEDTKAILRLIESVDIYE